MSTFSKQSVFIDSEHGSPKITVDHSAPDLSWPNQVTIHGTGGTELTLFFSDELWRDLKHAIAVDHYALTGSHDVRDELDERVEQCPATVPGHDGRIARCDSALGHGGTHTYVIWPEPGAFSS